MVRPVLRGVRMSLDITKHTRAGTQEMDEIWPGLGQEELGCLDTDSPWASPLTGYKDDA